MNKRAILIRNAAASDFGGGEKVPVLLSKMLQQYDIDPIVFSGSKKLLEFAQMEKVPHKKTWWWPHQNWSGVKALLFPIYVIWQIVLYFYYLTLFIHLKPTIIHVQSKDDFIAATFAARTLHINVLWSDHADLKHIWANYNIWYKNPVGKLVYLAASGAKHIIVVSKNDKQLISQQIPDGSIKDKLTIIYNGTFDTYSPTKKRSSFTFISTARLVTDKGIRELILAFKKLSKDYKDISLTMVGDGPEASVFKELAKGIDNITFLGHQTHPLNYVAEADVFVLPTYHEGLSLALVEACMEGLAVIATNVGGNPEIIDHKKTGLLIESKSVDALYDAMELLYKNEKLRLMLGMGARKKYVNNFNLERIMVNELLPLYKGN